jgi:TetR/AcrR family transcriptional regulator
MTDLNLSEHVNAERILREGWDFFQEKGYRGVSMDELCLRCGITKPTLYYYFHDKENLYVQVLLHQLGGFHSIIEEPGSLTQRLTRIAINILESFKTSQAVMIHDLSHIRSLQHSEQIRAAFQNELFKPLSEVMRQAVENGELENADPSFLANMYMGIINTFISRSSKLGSERSQLATGLVIFFLNGAGYNRTNKIPG